MSNSGGGLAGQHHAVVSTADPRKSGNAATAAAVQAAAAAAANRSAAVAAAVQAAAAAPEQQQPQDFDSWRHQQHQAAPPGYNLASDFYGLYQQNPFHHYTGFGVGGEGTWSNGDHMTFLSGYGTQLPGQETAQFGIDTTMFGAGAGGFGAFTQAPGYGFDFTGSAAGYSQWGAAANRAAAQQQGHAVGAAAQQQGHAAGPAAAAAQQGHGAAVTTVAGAVEHTPHQWGQPQRQQVATTEQQQYYRQEHYTQESRGRVAAAEQAMQGLHLATNNHTQDNKFQESKSEGADNSTKSHHNDTASSNQASSGVKLTQSGSASSGGSSGQPKKMSWASVASQPAKPPTTTKPKKPGVLSPPQLPATNKPPTRNYVPPTNVEIGTWDHTATSGHQQNGGGIPTPASSLMGMPPPLPGSIPVSTMHGHMPPATRGMMSGVGGVAMGGGGAASGAWMGGAPGGRPGPLGHNSVMNGVIPHHLTPIQTSHPPPSSVAAAPSTPAAPCHVLDELKSTNNYNPREFDLNPVGARFFVVKSYSEDDIHRSIKYEIWCSTEHGNKRLDAAFREREGKGPVYLFYSVNGSGHFCGMAQMLSGVDYSTTAKVWAQDKWKGKFQVKWIYVKDVPNQQLRHIKLENNENKPVTNSRDTQEVPHEKGKAVLKILVSYKHNTSIFDDFSHYEKRQEEEEGRKPHQNGRSDRHDSHPHHGGHPPSHRRGGGGGGDHYYNNNHHRDDTGEYRRGGAGGEQRGEHRGDDRRRGNDRDGDDNRGHGGGRGGRGGYYDRGGRGGKYQGGRRLSPVQKDGTTSNGNK